MRRITCEEMRAEWGERCPDFEPDCSACVAWSTWYLGKPRSLAELEETVDLILQRNPDVMARLEAIITASLTRNS